MKKVLKKPTKKVVAKKAATKKTVKAAKKTEHWVRFVMPPVVYNKARKKLKEQNVPWQPVLLELLTKWASK